MSLDRRTARTDTASISHAADKSQSLAGGQIVRRTHEKLSVPFWPRELLLKQEQKAREDRVCSRRSLR